MRSSVMLLCVLKARNFGNICPMFNNENSDMRNVIAGISDTDYRVLSLRLERLQQSQK